MKELVDFCDISNSIECKNRIDCELFNTKLSNQQVDIVLNHFSLNTHPKGAKLIIYVNHQPILEFGFNYLREFYGDTDKWKNINLQLFHQNETIRHKVDYGYRRLPYDFFILYDKHNEFLIKSSNLSCTINNQTITIDHNFLNFNEFLKSNLSYFNTLS